MRSLVGEGNPRDLKGNVDLKKKKEMQKQKTNPSDFLFIIFKDCQLMPKSSEIPSR